MNPWEVNYQQPQSQKMPWEVNYAAPEKDFMTKDLEAGKQRLDNEAQAAITGITRIPLGILQGGAEGASMLSNSLGAPETGQSFQNAADIFKQVAAEQAAKGEQVKAENPIAATVANLVPQALQLGGFGMSLPGIAAGGFASGAAAPKLSSEDLQNAGYKPADTFFDKTMGALNYLPNKAVEAVGINPESRFGQGVQGSLVGIEGAKAIPAIVNRTADIVNPVRVKAGDVFNKADQNYTAMKDMGATFNRSGINKVTYSVGRALEETGLMNDRLHGDTMSVVKDLNKDAKVGAMDLERLDQYRQLLNQVVKNNTTKLEGMNSDAMKAQTAISAIDETVNSLNEKDLANGSPEAIDALNKGRALWSAGSKLQRVQNIIENSKSENNPSQYVRTQMKQWARNPIGLNPDEIAAVKDASKTGVIAGALKTMGSKITSGVVGTAAGAVGGGMIGAPIGGLVGEAVGYPMRKVADAMQKAKANQVIQTIAQRPEVQQALGLTERQIMKLPPSQAKPLLNKLMSTRIKQVQ